MKLMVFERSLDSFGDDYNLSLMIILGFLGFDLKLAENVMN